MSRRSASKPKARLVVKYKTRSPAQVTSTYTAKLANGRTFSLGALKQRFGSQGTGSNRTRCWVGPSRAGGGSCVQDAAVGTWQEMPVPTNAQ